ncbi:MAG: rdgB/HAM1 family non-canonical purine NTP pyrophosphatase [Candidatus Aramenus sulfurataquae]|uniref:dITP/XTP pyrophosphatase n=3 Tax=Candidatus Aramenus sulfurataquae TaxID=1326980 RepID=W7KQ87_9CREN|nr:MAG: rdgB/HAM1 family non-canonical purine NTP pyrophosphatase [Candidatus Aramenus sulfurataquae]
MRKDVVRLVTSNAHKFEEMSQIADEYGVKLEILNAQKIEIQADSLEEVARYSALLLFEMYRVPLVVDDSGLFIEELKGFPGPYTNFVKKTLDIDGILRLMTGVKQRRAYFETVICYVDEREVRTFSGRVYGRITERPSGEKGFGFDPIFAPDGSDRTFAEMTVDEKNKYSHRAKAFRKFLEYYTGRQ